MEALDVFHLGVRGISPLVDPMVVMVEKAEMFG
jgi:hypothetical protein